MGEIIDDFVAGVRTFETLKETIDEAQKHIHSDSVYNSLDTIICHLREDVQVFTDAIRDDIVESLGKINHGENANPK